MNFFQQIVQNRVLLVAIAAWFAAQGLKVIFGFIVEGKWDLSRFFGLGGMPSSHSAVVCSLATAVGIQYSFASTWFAVAFIFACVVMTDAAGVRRAAGKQAAVLNKILQDMIANGRGLTTETLKELLGHTPFEVVIGALLGILLAVIIM